MHKNILTVVGITILFLGLAIQPSLATIQLKEETDFKPKDYLFQTSIDIANNPEVKDLLEQYNHKIITSNYNYKGVFSKILFNNPRLFLDMLFTKPYINYDYLDKSYNRGIEIANIIGEDNFLEMIASIEVTNPELFNEFNNIIMNEKELSGRLATLKVMNKQYMSDLSWNFPIICGILILIFIYQALKIGFFWEIFFNNYYEMKPNIQGIFEILLLKAFILIGFSIGL
jgi:hypothetical protein